MNVNGLRRNDIECLLKTHTAALFQGQLGSVSAACTTFPEKTSKSILSMVNSEIKNTMSTILVNYTLLFKNPCIMVIKGNLDILMCGWMNKRDLHGWQ